MIARGALRDTRALLLPQSIALSPEAASAIRGFAANGGLVLAEGDPAYHVFYNESTNLTRYFILCNQIIFHAQH